MQDRSNATASCAGLFINAHLGFDYPGTWLHIDMAAPVHNVSGSSHTVILNSLILSFKIALGPRQKGCSRPVEYPIFKR